MSKFIHVNTVTDLFRFFKLEHTVKHPLIAVVDFKQARHEVTEPTGISTDVYSIMFKNYDREILSYGRKPVDFHNGSLICLAPQQVLVMEADNEAPATVEGWGVYFHPDLIRATSLNDKIKNYTFFSYEVSEALHLSEKEKTVLADCVQNIETELQENIDVHSEDIIVSNIELLLNYCKRFYGRQFITRKSSNNAVVTQIEKILSEYFKHNNITEQGLPTVKYLADKVNLSASYLSDLLKKETGKNTQDHIHYYLIEEAKSILLSTNKSVGEIAYGLGFEYPQYFNKLFKQKTGKTPVEFRVAG
ncbi:helix-turn-helix domain-containing protein [Mucilaginibacter pedocola]|uniref:Transcriptional regulator n=1 Tax=Mucilaginibacter pedocola TaxID=1792845 RepID=A0A1S9PKY1_9SPHI|nr:AraC family transcriptional regulator [Mucilaginibacter pedocola]OOQ61607.1 transcriptional regulator [Mucilaginibacter pedocola]